MWLYNLKHRKPSRKIGNKNGIKTTTFYGGLEL